jgi:hypothetical protein
MKQYRRTRSEASKEGKRGGISDDKREIVM